jgi:hypothetical protein
MLPDQFGGWDPYGAEVNEFLNESEDWFDIYGSAKKGVRLRNERPNSKARTTF